MSFLLPNDSRSELISLVQQRVSSRDLEWRADRL